MSPSPVTPEPKPQTQNDTVSDNPSLRAETELYTALRGLNVSLLNAVSKAIETDPFTDIAIVFERYKTLRISVQSDYEDNLKKVAAAPPLVASAVPHSPAVSLAFGSKSFAPSDPQPKSSAAMPAPPTAFSGFGNLSSASDSGSGGFTPKLELAPSDSKASAPGFGSFTPLTSDNASGTASARSSFTFGRSSSSTSSPPTSAFTSGDSNRSIVSKSNPFGSDAPSVFNSNLFGQPDSTDDKEKATEKDNAIASTVSSVFGGASFSTPEKSSPSFAFGSSPSKPTAFGGFGGTKPGSFGNPVGFGFGSPPKTPDDTGPAPSSSPRFTGFSFGAPPKAADATESSGDVSEAASGEATPAPEDAPQLLVTSTSIYDTEGPGEEDEETAHQIRSKVYKMSKNSDGKSEWNDLGVGVLRVKVHKEGGTRRLLLRNSSTGKVIINFNVYKDMSPSVSKNTVAFVGREGGAPASYRLRVKTAEHANDLKKAIDKEIEFVKAKASDAQ
ncbi:hypothetical protein PHLCEN_2v128 [Hermanssonia centrifuga]|uniref:RanBD1 domain-containing protein n=1 Tax=Hermanssonia centrifuga TaxID=98765 RepID=A0A2R6S720_9APHY|nr:hypothetical protein PHLCEN_2v128 [Hermanssonia centrifuga]